MSHESELQIAVHLMMEKFKHYLLFKLHGNVSEQVKMLMIVFRFRSSFQVFLQTLPGGQKEVDCVQLLGLGIDFCNSYRVSLSEASLRDRKPQKSHPYLVQEKTRMLMESLVISTISYMGTLYVSLPSNQKKIQKMMNLAARTVLCTHPRTHVEEMLLELY